jgi:predicted acylesterase/phospholipase RssA
MTLSRAKFLSLIAAFAPAAAPTKRRALLPPWEPLPPPLPLGNGKALVLSGAGARGAYEAGALKWLYRNVAAEEKAFDVICGSSAGAINAIFAAVGTADAIRQSEDLWRHISAADVIRVEPPVQDIIDAGLAARQATRHSFPANIAYLNRARRDINAAGPLDQIEQLGGAVNDAGIRALVQKYAIPLNAVTSSLLISTTNITKMAFDAFYRFAGQDANLRKQQFLEKVKGRAILEKSEGTPPLFYQLPLYHELTQDNFSDALLASISMPGVFKPVLVRQAESAASDYYVDGGLVSNLSVSLAVDAGAYDITILTASAAGELPKNETNLPGVLHEAYALMHEQILQDDMNLAIAKNLIQRDRSYDGLNRSVRAYLSRQQETQWRPLTLRIIRPRSPLEATTLGFNHQDRIDAAFETGYADASQPSIYTMG